MQLNAPVPAGGPRCHRGLHRVTTPMRRTSDGQALGLATERQFCLNNA